MTTDPLNDLTYLRKVMREATSRMSLGRHLERKSTSRMSLGRHLVRSYYGVPYSRYSLQVKRKKRGETSLMIWGHDNVQDYLWRQRAGRVLQWDDPEEEKSYLLDMIKDLTRTMRLKDGGVNLKPKYGGYPGVTMTDTPTVFHYLDLRRLNELSEEKNEMEKQIVEIDSLILELDQRLFA